MQGLSNWLMGISVSENDLIICQAIPSEPSVPKPRPAVIVEYQGVCSSFSNRRCSPNILVGTKQT